MNNYKITLLALALLGLWSCERSEIEGPELDELYGPFSVEQNLTASGATADFATGSVSFSAEFGRRVNWEIHLEGQSSGGKKIIYGRSSVIDETNSTWEGTTTIFPLLEAGEEVKGYLVITSLEEGETFVSDTLTIDINTAIDYSKFNALLLEDFNDGHSPQTDLTATDTNWAYPGISFVNAFEGARFMRTSFQNINWDHFVNGFELHPDTGTYFNLPKRSDQQLYLNFALKGVEDGGETVLQMYIGEDDDGDGQSGAGWNAEAGAPFPHADDIRTINMKMEGITEWTWMSIPIGTEDVADGFPIDCGEDGCEGNSAIDMDRITSVGFRMIQEDLTDKVLHIEMDMIYFSWGGPLEGF